MDQEEFIIYDETSIKKEYEDEEDPLSIEEVPQCDPLDPEAESHQGSNVAISNVAIKEEAIAEWNKMPEHENEKHEEIITSQHSEPSVAPFILSRRLHSPPERLPSDALDLSCNGDSQEPPASNATSLRADQSNYADANQPEVICLDSDSDDEQRDSQVFSSNCNSESDVWTKNLEEPADPGAKCNIDFENNREPETEHNDSSSEISNKKTKFLELVKVLKKRMDKEQQKLLHCDEDASSATVPALCEDVPRTSQAGLAETVSAGAQATASSQELLLRKQLDSRDQSVWSPIHQIIALSSQLLSQQQQLPPSQSPPLSSQQSTTPAQSSLLQSRHSLASVVGSQSASQHSVAASTHSSQLKSQKQLLAASTETSHHVSQQSPLLTNVPSILRKRVRSPSPDAHLLGSQQSKMPSQLSARPTKVTTAPNQPRPLFLRNKIYAKYAKRLRLADASAANSETKNANAKPQAEATATNINSESELLNLKHKMEVQELKLRLRTKKARAELEESDLKLKMKTTMQELTNKKLKEQILLAKLQFYTKLCAGEKL